MFSRSALLVFGLAVVEFFLFVFLARAFGFLPVALITLLLSVGGLYYLARFAPKVLRQGFKQLLDSGGDVDADRAGDQAGQVLAGLLLATPGILTGVGGLLLLVRPVRKLLSPRFGAKVIRFVPAGPISAISALGRQRRGNVIDVDVVDSSSAAKKSTKAPHLPSHTDPS